MEEGRVVSEYTKDGTVDLKGKPILKSKSGGWKACSFVVGISLSHYKFYMVIFILFWTLISKAISQNIGSFMMFC